MKAALLFTALLLPLAAIGQTVREMTPVLGALIDKSPEGEAAFFEQIRKCEELWDRVNNERDYQKLSDADKEAYDNCSEDETGYWDVIGAGCSWYCGGGQDTLSATSELKAHKNITYSASNAHDLSFQTAWVEGVPGYGIGERLTYHFPPENPRITKIIVVNGYVKSEKAWRENSRVKKLKMYLNGKPFAVLHLEDTREEQEFSFAPIGNGDREDWEALEKMPWWTMTFEILDVYPGEKYDDTAITEIYFDGIDVH